mgnify:CR=1 FL=1
MSKQFGPVVAGKFYPKEREDLLETIESCYTGSHGPGEVASPVERGLDESLGIVAPHAGYEFSGPVAAHAYSWLARFGRPSAVIIIGTNHSGFGPPVAIAKKGRWATPLGAVEINEGLADELLKNSSEIKNRTTPFSREHSLEVQLPFLQHLWGSDFSFVPICIRDQGRETAAEVGAAIEEAAPAGTIVIASTDFSHYPPYEKAREVDSVTANAILSNDPEELNRTLERNKFQNIEGLATSLCGWTSVLTLMHLTEDKDDLEYVDLEYKNSGDSRMGDKDKVVGYHAISVFRKNGKKKEHDDFSLNEQEKQWLLDLSYQTLRKVVGNEKKAGDGSNNVPIGLKTPAGAFVSLYKNGKLRGCIGHFGEDKPLYKVVEEMTRAAALNDPRFNPVSSEEIDDIKVEISVLTPMRKVDDVSKIEPGKHGILIRKGGRSGTFLPQVADKTGWNREELLGHCARDKAGLSWDGWKDAEVFIYEAIVFSG